jgi:hypothetical protein
MTKEEITLEHVNNPDMLLDNLDALDMYLSLRRIPEADKKQLRIPYENGFYKTAGKSAPFFWPKTSRYLKSVGFERDIASVLHDWRYYTGLMPYPDGGSNYRRRKAADREYYKYRKMIDPDKIKPWLEYRALRLFGGISWRKHKKFRETVPEYGTVQGINTFRIMLANDQL